MYWHQIVSLYHFSSLCQPSWTWKKNPLSWAKLPPPAKFTFGKFWFCAFDAKFCTGRGTKTVFWIFRQTVASRAKLKKRYNSQTSISGPRYNGNLDIMDGWVGMEIFTVGTASQRLRWSPIVTSTVIFLSQHSFWGDSWRLMDGSNGAKNCSNRWLRGQLSKLSRISLCLSIGRKLLDVLMS